MECTRVRALFATDVPNIWLTPHSPFVEAEARSFNSCGPPFPRKKAAVRLNLGQHRASARSKPEAGGILKHVQNDEGG
jgi:hypothetical protein